MEEKSENVYGVVMMKKLFFRWFFFLHFLSLLNSYAAHASVTVITYDWCLVAMLVFVGLSSYTPLSL